jgi:hypothetical protein
MPRRQAFTLRVRFEPVRMAREQLRVAYEMVAPTRRALVRSAPEEKAEVPVLRLDGKERQS